MAISETSVHELHDLGTTSRIIDVREPHEWQQGHIGHAEHIPLGALTEQLDRLDGGPFFLVCRSGGRSARACELAGARGYDVVNVTGGMLAWAAAGYDVVTGG